MLFSTVRTYLENIAQVPEAYDGQIASTGFSVLRSNGSVHPKYLFYYSLTQQFLEPLNELQRGTSYPAVRDNDVRVQVIPVPPLPEQERIVAKIEELFTQLEAGTNALERVRAGLRRYKASVLKAAVSGRLVNGNLEIGEGELPEGWRFANIEEVSKNIVDCLHSTPKFADSGKYCVDTTWIEPSKFVFERARYVSEETYKQRIVRLEPKAGDVLFAREGTIGTAVVVPENMELCLGQRMMMFRPNETVTSEYLSWTILSPVFQKQWKPKIIGTTSPHINIGDIRKMIIPLPPLEEQRQIVAEVERRLSVAREVESAVEGALVRAARLRQSVLKSAFEGRLV